MKRISLSLLIYWSAVLTGAASAGDEASDPNSILEQSRMLRRQFIMQTTSSVAEKTLQEQEDSLAKLIEQVRSLQTPLVRQDPNTPPVLKKTTETVQTTPPSTKAVLSDPNTTGEEILKKLEQETSILSPIQLADVLYRAGKPEQALRFYEMALQGAEKETPTVHQWLLFQTANCLKATDADRAGKLYEELIRLYPNSGWAPVSQARRQMLGWLEANKKDVEKRISLRNTNEQ
jgi:tetratricopeptide (TPR) repeat protein